MNKKRIVVGKCEDCSKELRTRGSIRPIMKLTCKCGHANTIYVNESLLRPWREEQAREKIWQEVLVKQKRNNSRLRYVDRPYKLTELLKVSPDGTELIIGSAFFMRRLPQSSDYEVWLTPKRCHFKVSSSNLSKEAQKVIDNNLPRFESLFKPKAKKISIGNEWNWQGSTKELDFIQTPSDALGYVNSFCIMGNWITLAGPYVFHDPGYREEQRRWGWLKDINVSFIEEILEINFICSEKPWLTENSFSDFVIKSSNPCASIFSKLNTWH